MSKSKRVLLSGKDFGPTLLYLQRCDRDEFAHPVEIISDNLKIYGIVVDIIQVDDSRSWDPRFKIRVNPIHHQEGTWVEKWVPVWNFAEIAVNREHGCLIGFIKKDATTIRDIEYHTIDQEEVDALIAKVSAEKD